MAALQSGHRPRPARSSRAQARQKVWPQGMKAALFPRAIHTQHLPPTLLAPPPFLPSSDAATSSTRVHAPPPAVAAVHCCSACSSSAISDTLLSPSPGAGGVGGAAAGDARRREEEEGAVGARSSSAPLRMTSRSVRRLPAAARRVPSSSSSSRSLRRSRRLEDAASCCASVTPPPLRRSISQGPGGALHATRQLCGLTLISDTVPWQEQKGASQILPIALDSARGSASDRAERARIVFVEGERPMRLDWSLTQHVRTLWRRSGLGATWRPLEWRKQTASTGGRLRPTVSTIFPASGSGAEFLCGREQRSGDRERRLPAAGVWKFSLKSGGGLDAGCHAASTR
ncbi:hypothetical protein BRADI_4g34481v3 [Brachypodium distachyon]|uniref:Uncharacterized protein n=1 Tax=Brachypodium distachyon TaxID=15368 RepID=A0A0Q3PN78_BRADI|nr:hypothetical protein BRADI_4g34481v3 [Brachypodium distachyon]